MLVRGHVSLLGRQEERGEACRGGDYIKRER